MELFRYRVPKTINEDFKMLASHFVLRLVCPADFDRTIISSHKGRVCNFRHQGLSSERLERNSKLHSALDVIFVRGTSLKIKEIKGLIRGREDRNLRKMPWNRTVRFTEKPWWRRFVGKLATSWPSFAIIATPWMCSAYPEARFHSIDSLVTISNGSALKQRTSGNRRKTVNPLRAN